MLLLAPSSGYLNKIHIGNGELVQPRAVIAEMDDKYEQSKILQINILQKINEFARKRITDKKLYVIDECDEIRWAAAASLVQFREDLKTQVKQDRDIGAADGYAELYSNVALSTARYERQAIELEFACRENEVEKTKQLLELYSDILQKQKDIAEKKLDQLKIIATTAGRIRWYIFEGGYAEQGEPIASLSPTQ